ncbi:MAG: N-6 DNA methylase [Cytophagales bacterium]|nr:N-6 DNA methylase [Cytophagales bacterium]
MNLIETGIKKGLIRFDEERNFITYIHQNKKRNYNEPEVKVQAETFLKLIIRYNYPVERVKNYVSVQMGSEPREADIIVYEDEECEKTHIVVECKKEEITDQAFNKAVDQAYSYAVAEGGKFVWTTSKIKDEYYEIPEKKPKSRIVIPDIPQFGVKKLAPYKYVKGGILQTDTSRVVEPEVEYIAKQKFFELEVVSENELTKIFIQAHQALWGGGQRNPSVAFDELDKLIFCKIWDEKHPRKSGDPYDFQIFRDETPDELLKRVQELYSHGRKKDPEVFKEGINLSADETQTIVKYLQRINLNKTDLDSKGKAFETFMGSYFRGDFGQYFTPRPIVKFIVDSLPIDNSKRVLDTSCGSGGFLLYALDKVREQANEFYDKDKEEKDHFRHWHDFAEKNLFGIEINDQIARTAKMNMIIHDDGHTNVIATDGLLNDEELQIKSRNKEFEYSTFDFIVTNPPFGSIIKQTEKAYMHQYSFGKKEQDWLSTNGTTKETIRDSQSTEILFLEQCHKFLTEQGYLAIVIPDGILTNSSLQYVRDNLEELYRMVAVVSMPQTAFTATGAGVKSSVLFLRKHKEKATEKISNQKVRLKEQLKKDNKFIETIEKWEKEKSIAIKKLEEATKKKNPNAVKKEISQLLKEEKSKLQSAFTDKVNLLKEEMTGKYFEAKQQTLDDYSIFMAITEDIGYDATGRNTGNNELIEIGKELSKFITHINKTEK